MAKEDALVGEALRAAEEIVAPPLSVRRGAALLYQVTVDNRLQLQVDPTAPVRGQSAFQTDLCVFEEVEKGVAIPRVVLEFKPGITTHDVLTYSAKARKHKQVYPYLRYGLLIGSLDTIPGRVFTHNESLDFVVAAGAFKAGRLHEVLTELLREELAASRKLEAVFFGSDEVHLFRTKVDVQKGRGRLT